MLRCHGGWRRNERESFNPDTGHGKKRNCENYPHSWTAVCTLYIVGRARQVYNLEKIYNFRNKKQEQAIT